MALDLKKLFPGLSGGDGGDDLATKLKKIQDAIGRNAEISIDAPSQPLGTSIVNRPIEEVPSAPLDASPAFLSNQSDDDPAWGMAREAAKARQRNQLMARRAQMPAQIAAPDPMYGGRGDAAIPAGANWSMQNEMERAGQQTAANNAQVMAAAQRYAGMKIPNADETGYAATGRNLPDAITDEGPPPPGYAEYLRRTGNTGVTGQPRTSTDISNQILDVQANYKDPHKHSVLGRLFKGFGKAWKQWEPSDGGGLIGLGLSMLGGGIGSAVSPEVYEDYEKKDRLRKMFPQLGIARQQEDFANKQRTEQMQAANYQSQINNRGIQTQLDMSESVRKQIAADQEPYLKQWADLEEFDPNDLKYKDWTEAAARKGVVLIPKSKGQRYAVQIAPDGRVVTMNTSTGEYKIGNENLSRPVQISEKDLPDEMFGLASEKEISDKAQASVGELPKGRSLRVDVAQSLAQSDPQFRNSDGTLNEQAYWRAYGEGDTDIKPSHLYESLPSDYEQRVASSRSRLRDSQKGLRSEVATFRSALMTHRPMSNAVTLPLPKVVDGFKQILQIKDAKVRAAKLKEYYTEVLPYIRIG